MFKSIFLTALFLVTAAIYADMSNTGRTPQFSNDQVTVWQTIIYPSKGQQLTMHRHENNRVLVAFDSGTLKITDNTGKTHYLKLEKDKSYWLTKDAPGETHTDENISDHPIKVLVMEVKS